jgi:hypothetical protein
VLAEFRAAQPTRQLRHYSDAELETIKHYLEHAAAATAESVAELAGS